MKKMQIPGEKVLMRGSGRPSPLPLQKDQKFLEKISKKGLTYRRCCVIIYLVREAITSKNKKLNIWVWRSLVACLNGVQEAGSSNLLTQT